MTDGETPDYFEVSTTCEIDGCWVMLIGDTRCTEHGGKPTMETHSDAWGREWTVVKGDPNGVTDSH